MGSFLPHISQRICGDQAGTPRMKNAVCILSRVSCDCDDFIFHEGLYLCIYAATVQVEHVANRSKFCLSIIFFLFIFYVFFDAKCICYGQDQLLTKYIGIDIFSKLL